jgi:uncharacterized membrane protein YqjE
VTAHNQDDSTNTESLLQQVQALEREVRGVVKTQLQLAGLETRQAGESLVRMVALAVILGCVVFTAWIALLAAIVVASISAGIVSLTTALLITVIAHAAIAFYLTRLVRRRGRDLLFSQTSSNF